MNLIGLHTESILARIAEAAVPPRVPTIRQSLFIGGLGFGLVGLAAFAVWAVGGKALTQAVGEAGLYALCALVFIGLAGLVFGQLVIGPGGTVRIYGLFTLAFTAYSAVWCAAWFGLRGTLAAEVGGGVWTKLAWKMPVSVRRAREWARLLLLLPQSAPQCWSVFVLFY
jgi:hypothetical protein